MVKSLWINLPVKDIERSKAFFSTLGFTFNSEYGNTPNSACLQIGNVIVMLFDEPMFKSFTNKEITDVSKSTEVLLSFDAESKNEVDEIAKKVIAAGGKTSHVPSEMVGWMYGFIFTDLDGHSWNVLYMDKMQGA